MSTYFFDIYVNDEHKQSFIQFHDFKLKHLLNISFNQWTYISLEFEKTSCAIYVDKDIKISFSLPNDFNIKNLIMKPIILSPDNEKQFCGCIGYMRIIINGEHSILREMDYPPNSKDFIIHKHLPLSSINDLKSWSKEHSLSYQKSIYPLYPRDNERISFNENKNIPHVILCHDFKGGYLNDKYHQGTDESHVYYFRQWSMIDIFIYFSHHRITIPPSSWINIAHKNGVKILGTIITEGDEGTEETMTLIYGQNDNQMYYADKLIDIAVTYGFDGWLLNIENILQDSDIPYLLNFVEYLTKKIKEKIPSGCVIWYDAVTLHGDLSWQNELNELNKPFFLRSDGIFLNYFWEPSNLKRTKSVANCRDKDIYVGIDVFGRGTYGGGGFDLYQALKEINEHQFSCAIFAPGWIYEVKSPLNRDLYEKYTAKLWGGVDFVDLFKVKEPQWHMEGPIPWERLSINDGYQNIEHDPSLASSVFVSSFKWCIKVVLFDVYKYGFTKEMVEKEPIIEISEWYKGTGPNVNDHYRLIVILYDEKYNVLDEFDSDVIITCGEWKEIKHRFFHYGKNLRYIQWRSFGKDSENWKGYYGTKTDHSSLKIHLFHEDKSIHLYIKPYPKVLSLPFVTCFNSSVGDKYFIKGEKVQEQPWNDLNQLDILPDCLDGIYQHNYDILVSLDYESAYYGGSSLKVEGKIKETKVLELFTLNRIKLKENHPLNVQYALKNQSNNVYVDILVEYTDGRTSSLVQKTDEDMDESMVSPSLIEDHYGWKVYQYQLDVFDDLSIQKVYLILSSSNNEWEKVSFLLGCFKMYQDINLQVNDHINDVEIEQSFNIESLTDEHDYHDLTIHWKSSNNNGNQFYNIYLNSKYQGRSYYNSFQIKKARILQDDNVTPSTISIQHVNYKLDSLPLNELKQYKLKKV